MMNLALIQEESATDIQQCCKKTESGGAAISGNDSRDEAIQLLPFYLILSQ